VLTLRIVMQTSCTVHNIVMADETSSSELSDFNTGDQMGLRFSHLHDRAVLFPDPVPVFQSSEFGDDAIPKG
jgi:hypothetical protein